MFAASFLSSKIKPEVEKKRRRKERKRNVAHKLNDERYSAKARNIEQRERAEKKSRKMSKLSRRVLRFLMRLTYISA